MNEKALLFRWPRLALNRGQVALLVTLALLTVAGWTLTVYQARTMDMSMGVVVRGGADPDEPAAMADGMADMPGMAMETSTADAIGAMAASGMSGMGWAWSGFLAFLLAWAVMMAAMMFPAAAPMLLFFHRVAVKRAGPGTGILPTWTFAAGYLVVWSAIGAATWVLVRLASEAATRLDAPDRATWAPIALGAVLVVAGLYQFTPLKAACLRQCQSPLGFVMMHWRDGHLGAFRMGLRHGAYCLGCCWSLFAVLVAAGVMSLAWMLVLTLVVFAEKVLPVGTRAARATGGALLLLGIVVAAGVISFPWSV